MGFPLNKLRASTRGLGTFPTMPEVLTVTVAFEDELAEGGVIDKGYLVVGEAEGDGLGAAFVVRVSCILMNGPDNGSGNVHINWPHVRMVLEGTPTKIQIFNLVDQTGISPSVPYKGFLVVEYVRLRSNAFLGAHTVQPDDADP